METAGAPASLLDYFRRVKTSRLCLERTSACVTITDPTAPAGQVGTIAVVSLGAALLTFYTTVDGFDAGPTWGVIAPLVVSVATTAALAWHWRSPCRARVMVTPTDLVIESTDAWRRRVTLDRKAWPTLRVAADVWARPG